MSDRPGLKIAYLTAYLPPFRLGFLESLESRVRELRVFESVGMEPHRDWPVDPGNLNVTRQRNLTLARWWRHPAGFRDRIFMQFPLDTVGRLRRFEPDAVITDELGARTALVLLFRDLFAPQTAVVAWTRISLRTERGRGRTRKLLRPWLTRRLDGAVIHSRGGARYLRRLGLDESSIWHTPQAADLEAFLRRPTTAQHDPLRVLIVSQFSERKGILEFLELAGDWGRRHPDRRIEIRLAGSGPLRGRLEAARPATNVAVRVLGSFDWRDLPEVYAEADLMAFPSHADSWGMVVNEAMAAGLPVLGSVYATSVEELVENGVTGWVYRPDRPTEAAGALELALGADRETLAHFGRRGRRKISGITHDGQVEIMLKAVRAAMATRPNGRREESRPRATDGRVGRA